LRPLRLGDRWGGSPSSFFFSHPCFTTAVSPAPPFLFAPDSGPPPSPFFLPYRLRPLSCTPPFLADSLLFGALVFSVFKVFPFFFRSAIVLVLCRSLFSFLVNFPLPPLRSQSTPFPGRPLQTAEDSFSTSFFLFFWFRVLAFSLSHLLSFPVISVGIGLTISQFLVPLRRVFFWSSRGGACLCSPTPPPPNPQLVFLGFYVVGGSFFCSGVVEACLPPLIQ